MVMIWTNIKRLTVLHCLISLLSLAYLALWIMSFSLEAKHEKVLLSSHVQNRDRSKPQPQPQFLASSLAHTGKCDLTVMMETNNASEYICEMVAYYFAHGAQKIILFDHTPSPTVRKRIQEQLSLVFQNHDLIYLHSNSSFSRQRQQAGLTRRVHSFIQNNVQFHNNNNNNNNNNKALPSFHPRPHWLITVDDDEYMYPSLDYLQKAYPALGINNNNNIIVHNDTLLDFLCSPFVLQYPIAYFRWRFVGSSHIAQRRPHSLDLETYKLMQTVPVPGKARSVGKSVFYLNHEKMSPARWLAQDAAHLQDPTRRPGGAFFLHGHRFDYSALERSQEGERNNTLKESTTALHQQTLQVGFTYHFTRSQQESKERTQKWQGPRMKIRRDINDVEDLVLAQWGKRMRKAGWFTW